MAGITHFQEILKKKGKDFVEKLFDKYVTVNEKLDSLALSFEKNQYGKLDFFKRHTEVPISTIDRTLMKLYETPIYYIESLDQSIINKIPANWRFGMEYFTDENSQDISYDRLPKNNLILSYIHVKNSNGKVVRTIQSKDELDVWADLIGIERSPILFQGLLNDDQKIKILDFIATPFDQLLNKFKTESTVKFIISVLNPKLKKSTLNDDLNKSIEGIVFRFGEDDDKETVLAKLVDPVFDAVTKSNTESKNDDESNDVFQLTVIDLMNFLDSLNLKKFQPKGKTLEDRYINFICQVFNSFIDQYGDKYKDVSFNEPTFLKKKAFDLNLTFITNHVTLEFIEENESFKKIFKIFLASFKKKKKKSNGLFSAELIKQFNETVDKVYAHISNGLVIKESEDSSIPTFGEFKMLNGSYLDDSDSDVDEFIEFGSKVLEAPQDIEEADSFQKEPADKKGQKKDIKKRVNIIVGRFQPFHNGHLSMAYDLHELNKLPVVIVVVYPGHNKSGNSPFNTSTIKSMMSNLANDSEGVIKDYCIVKRGFINDILDKLREMGYEPVLWGAGEDRINDYQKQLEHNYKKGNELKLDPDFQLVKTDRYGSATEVRKEIKSGQFGQFKKLVPKSVQSVYNLLKNDIDN